jgi:hypothetical protein
VAYVFVPLPVLTIVQFGLSAASTTQRRKLGVLGEEILQQLLMMMTLRMLLSLEVPSWWRDHVAVSVMREFPRDLLDEWLIQFSKVDPRRQLRVRAIS